VKLFFVLLAVTCSIYALQTQVVFPIESSLTQQVETNLVSLLYLPHGMKTLLFAILGLEAIPVVFVSQLLAGLVQGYDMLDSLLGGAFGTVAFVIALLIIRKVFSVKLRYGLIKQPFQSEALVWRNTILLAVFASMMNSTLHCIWYVGSDKLSAICPLKFLVGDTLGAILLFTILIYSRTWLTKISIRD
jgi:hypothetical protein